MYMSQSPMFFLILCPILTYCACQKQLYISLFEHPVLLVNYFNNRIKISVIIEGNTKMLIVAMLKLLNSYYFVQATRIHSVTSF